MYDPFQEADYLAGRIRDLHVSDVYKRQRGYYLIQPPKIMGKDDNYYGQIRITEGGKRKGTPVYSTDKRFGSESDWYSI